MLTAKLGVFISRLKFADLPAPVVATALQGFTDCVGAMLAGSREPVTAAAERVMLADRPSGRSTLYFGTTRTSAPAAAWINGTAAHALDYDDVALKGSHPSAVLVPAILAEAQTLNSSGHEMIAAYVAGYEVWGELIGRDRGNYQRKGWHPTGVFGALGAAAACSSLRHLDAAVAAHALGIASSQSCGVMSNLGSMVKPMHPGNAASSGILAARFAEAGITATIDALEHPQGFLSAVSPAGEIDLQAPPTLPPAKWRMAAPGLSIKQYPVCYRAHRAIDAMLKLLKSHPVQPENVREIRVSFSKSHAVILKNHRPQDAVAAKFSIEFAMACAVLAGRVGLRDLTDEFVRSSKVRQLLERVAIDIDPEEEAGTSGYAPYDSVQITLADGQVLHSEKVRYAMGDPHAPLTAADMWAKFEDCCAWSGLPLNAKALFGKLQRLDRLESVNSLFDVSTPVGKRQPTDERSAKRRGAAHVK